MNKISNFYKRHSYIYSAIIVLVIIIIIALVHKKDSNNLKDTVVVHPQNFAQNLSVSGTVQAAQDADLGFAQSGRIAGVYASVGDSVKAGAVLAKIENGDLQADLLQKQATLQKAQADLASTEQGTRPEELALTTQKYNDAVTAYSTALHSAYLQIQQALLTKSDTLFTNGNSSNPTLTIPTDTYSQERIIENERVALNQQMNTLKSAIDTLDQSTGTPSKDVLIKTQSVTNITLNAVKQFLNDLAIVTGNLNPSGPGAYSQTTINGYRGTVNDASQQVSTAANSINTAQSAVNDAENALALEQAGSTQNDISAQTALVKAAQADVLSAEADLAKTVVTAPFDGIVTKMDAKVGEIASQNTSDITVNSNGIFQIVSNVPEVYISNLQVGNTASTTLDAYGPDTYFAAKVIAIDPAQTVVNGVSNYKTTLQFLTADSRIKAGMTANISITTANIPDAYVVPQGAVFSKGTQQYVQIKQGDKTVNEVVTTGASSSIGTVQILSGLRDGDIVLLNPTIN